MNFLIQQLKNDLSDLENFRECVVMPRTIVKMN